MVLLLLISVAALGTKKAIAHRKRSKEQKQASMLRHKSACSADSEDSMRENYRGDVMEVAILEGDGTSMVLVEDRGVMEMNAGDYALGLGEDGELDEDAPPPYSPDSVGSELVDVRECEGESENEDEIVPPLPRRSSARMLVKD